VPAKAIEPGLFGHCAQPGDNTVDQSPVSVGTRHQAWDGVWAAISAPAVVPRLSTRKAELSTSAVAINWVPELREQRLSTLSTAPMTTYLSYRSRTSQDVRGRSAAQNPDLSLQHDQSCGRYHDRRDVVSRVGQSRTLVRTAVIGVA
jgi:hypothetical protein